MRQRSFSAIFVVIGILLPALFGGPIWAIAIAIFVLVALYEFHNLCRAVGVNPLRVGYLGVGLACLSAAADWDDAALIGSFALAIGLASLVALARQNAPGTLIAWALELAGTVYVTIPAIAAIELRQRTGTVSVDWIGEVTDWFSLGWAGHERGFAWLAFVVVVTWLGDTGAYLCGRSLGRRQLIASISPGKTVEGLIGGLLASVLFGLVANEILGLGLPIVAAAAAAFALGAVGVIGDLAESLLKRQAGIKDSGSLIPGHGGMLDRIDALLFTWTAGWYLAIFYDRVWQ